MALKVKVENKGGGGARVKPGVRLYLNADRSRLVPAGDPAGAYLFCTEGGEVLQRDLDRYGYEADKPKPRKRRTKKRTTKSKGEAV